MLKSTGNDIAVVAAKSFKVVRGSPEQLGLQWEQLHQQYKLTLDVAFIPPGNSILKIISGGYEDSGKRFAGFPGLSGFREAVIRVIRVSGKRLFESPSTGGKTA